MGVHTWVSLGDCPPFPKNWRKKRATRDVFKSRLKYVKEGKEKTGVSKKRKEVGNESPLVSMFVVQNQQIVNLPFDKCSSYVDGTDNNDIFALVDGNLIFDLET